VGEIFLGRRTRCIACGNTFVAGEQPPPAPPREPTTYPLRHEEEPDPPQQPWHDTWGRVPARQRLPLCPRCHRPVEWDAPACPNCLLLLDDGRDGPPVQRRRDGEDHRGTLIDSLGSICLFCAVMGLCTAGVGVLAALATGIPAVAMAAHDLERMRTGELDPSGRSATEMGRNKAVAGLVLAVVFGAVVVLIGMQAFLP
jgi:hypothetical protein